MVDLADISTHLENRTGCSLFSTVCPHPGAQLSDDVSEAAWGLLGSAPTASQTVLRKTWWRSSRLRMKHLRCAAVLNMLGAMQSPG